MKKLMLLGAFALLGGIAQAQEGFRLGGHIGAPIGDVADFSSVTLGIDAAYMWNVAKNFDLGATVGYTHFVGKNNSDDFGFFPIAASGKYKFTKVPIFVGLDLGAAISANSNVNGGLYIAPRVGYQMKKTELYLGFQNISSKVKHYGPYWNNNDFSFGTFNLGVNFFLK